MDESALHYELDNTKQQRAASCGRPTPQTTPEEMFSDDLAALKMRLQSMEVSLNYLNASHSQRNAQHVRHTAAQPNLPSLPTTLPSGPLFWQLFTSLRTDVRGLNSRVANVEESLSNLEDRVDGLDPRRFTPSSSNASMPWAPYQSPDSVGQQAAELRCHYQRYSPGWYPQYVSQPENNFPGSIQYVAGTENTAWTETTNGIAFRDREIARLEDILNRVQHDLQECEELVNHKDSQIEHLNYRQQSSHDEIAQLHQTIRVYNHIFAMNRRGSENYQEEYHSHRTQLVAAKRQIQELQETLSRAASSNQAGFDEAVVEKDIELSRLREFADRKDDIVRQQGGIIARGATIIQERDETIERLSRELKIAADDCRNAGRERERYSKLLEEKTGEVRQLRESLSQSAMPETPATTSGAMSSQSTVQRETRDEASSAPITPLAFGAPQEQRQSSRQWTPQPLGKFVNLPHEQLRAAVWGTGPTNLDRGKSGQAGQFSLQHSDSLKLLEKLALVEEDHHLSSLRSRTLGYQLDDFDITSGTPPALRTRPLDLSNSQHDIGAGHSDATSKHQHVHTEARRSLHAYVEAEDSREKRGDAA